MTSVLEIIGFNIESCIAAQDAGAGRIELCASPGEGGTTPSYAFIKEARKLLRIPLYVMIRPRGGDFLYSEAEYALMKQGIAVCKSLNCDGVVIGILDEAGNVDIDRCSRLVELAYPMGVTFHRAFDRVNDYKQSLKDVISTGCERILTSGLQPKCTDGLDVLADLIRLSNNDIIIMPGSGVTSSNARQIIEKTGASEIHSSASAKATSKMKYQNEWMKESLDHIMVNTEEIRKMVEVLQEI